MRHPTYHRNEQGRMEVKMTPMIDVIFLLLIFFVCTASFQIVEEVLPAPLNLPGSIASEVTIDQEWEDLDEIVVNIEWHNNQPVWQINQKQYNRLDEVQAVLMAAARIKIDLPVILDVEGEVPLENVIDIYDLCRQIGLRKVQFATSAPVKKA